MSIIGVEQSLTNVSEALLAKGYEVVELKHEADATGVDCCVITGLDNNALGIHDTSIQGSIIEAAGLSANEVCRKVEEKLNLH